MTRRSEQLDRIEGYARRLEAAAAGIARTLAEHGEDITAAKADAQGARSSAERAHASADAAHAGVQYLADTLQPPSLGTHAIPPAAPEPPSAVQQAAGGGTAGEAAAARRAPRTAPRDQM